MEGKEGLRDVARWQQQQQAAGWGSTSDTIRQSTEIEEPVRFNRQPQRSTRAAKEAAATSGAQQRGHQHNQSRHEANTTSHHDQRVQSNANFTRTPASQLARHAVHTSNYHQNPGTAQMALAEASRISSSAQTAPMYSHGYAVPQNVADAAHPQPATSFMRQHPYQVVSDADHVAIQRYLAEARSQEELDMRIDEVNRETAYQRSMMTMPRTAYVPTAQERHQARSHSRQPSVVLWGPAENVNFYNPHMVNPGPGYEYFEGYLPVAGYPHQLRAQGGAMINHNQPQQPMQVQMPQQAWTARHHNPSPYRARNAHQARVASSAHSTTGSHPQTHSTGFSSSTPYSRTSYTHSHSPFSGLPRTSAQKKSLAASQLSAATPAKYPSGFGHKCAGDGNTTDGHGITQVEDETGSKATEGQDHFVQSSYDTSDLRTSSPAPMPSTLPTSAKSNSPAPPTTNTVTDQTQVKKFIPDPPGPAAVFSAQTEMQIERLMLGNKRTLNRGRGPAMKRSKPNPPQKVREEPRYRLEPKQRIGRPPLSSPFAHDFVASRVTASSDPVHGTSRLPSSPDGGVQLGAYPDNGSQPKPPQLHPIQLARSRPERMQTVRRETSHYEASHLDPSFFDSSQVAIPPGLTSSSVLLQPVETKLRVLQRSEHKTDDSQIHKYKTRSKRVETASPLLSLEGPVMDKKIVVLPVALPLPAPAVSSQQNESSQANPPPPPPVPASRGSAIRNYLNDRVTPHVQLALKEMYEANPDKPLEYLANFLAARSAAVEGSCSDDEDAEGEPDEDQDHLAQPHLHLHRPHFNHPSSFDFEAAAAHFGEHGAHIYGEHVAQMPQHEHEHDNAVSVHAPIGTGGVEQLLPVHLDAEQFSAELMQMEDPNSHFWDQGQQQQAQAEMESGTTATTDMQMTVQDEEEEDGETTRSERTGGSPSSGSSWRS